MKKIILFMLLLIAICLIQIVPIFASTSTTSLLPPKPKTITLATYETTGGGYAQQAIIGEFLKREFDINWKPIPCPNDVSRVAMYNSGRTDLVALSLTAHFALEGIGPFAEISMGPQEYLCVYPATVSWWCRLGVRANSGIKTVADLKGKRVVYPVGNPGLTSIVEGTLAFGGLTWDDVEVVEISNTAGVYAAVVEGAADATVMTGGGSDAYKLEASPWGLYWLPMLPEDVEGWERFMERCPYMFPQLFTYGVGASEENPVWAGAYGQTIFGSPDLDENIAYWTTKAIWETNNLAAETSEVMKEFNLKEVGLKAKWIYPWHPGSIKYLKEVGLWGPVQERNQQPLIDRQKALAKLWEETIDEAIDLKMTSKEYPAFWLQKRSERFPEWYKPVFD